MKVVDITPPFFTRTFEEPEDILRAIHFGNRAFPLWMFNDYILHELNVVQAKSIVLYREYNDEIGIAGHMLLFNYNNNILYFGFFNVYGDWNKNNEFKFQLLISELINYAKTHNFKSIIGPLNIPIMIFGRGFAKKGSAAGLFIGKPNNLPIYPKMFKKYRFKVIKSDITWMGNLSQVNFPNVVPNEVFEPSFITDWNKILELSPIISKLVSQKNLMHYFNKISLENYVRLLVQYGSKDMFSLIHNKETHKIEGFISYVPNPFSKDEKGEFESISLISINTIQSYTEKDLGRFILNEINEFLKRHNFSYIYIRSDENQKDFAYLLKDIGFKHNMTHEIFQLKL